MGGLIIRAPFAVKRKFEPENTMARLSAIRPRAMMN